jgi:hypothetical protein
MMKMKGADAFERSLKEALDTYEVPFNSADWAQLERQLDSGRTSPAQSSAGLYMLLLGGTVAVLTTTYFMLDDRNSGGMGEGAVVMITGHDQQNTSDEQNINYNDVIETPAADRTVNITPEESAAADASSPAATATLRPRVSTPASGQATADLAKSPKKTAIPPAPKPDLIGGDADVTTNTSTSKAPAIRSSVTEGCPGTTIEFAADNMPGEGNLLWNFGDGQFSTQARPSHTYSKAGSFEVIVMSSMGGGMKNKPAADRIVIYEAPDAAFNYLKQEYDNTVPSVHFENRSIGGNKYLWDFGDGTTSSTPHPNHVFKKKGTYTVTLATTNANGCVDRTERTIVIDNDYDLISPKTFSPDGNGVEDTFIPEALKSLGARFHMSIFHPHTGDLIYETADAQRPWNGRIANKGELCSPGDYVWVVEMKDGEKLGGTYTGSVTLVR